MAENSGSSASPGIARGEGRPTAAQALGTAEMMSASTCHTVASMPNGARRLLDNFVQKPGDEWQVSESIRSACSFSVANLLDHPVGGQYDVVFLRNVLIYFEDVTRQRVFRNMAGAVRPGGYLILGASEGLLNVPEGFERVVRNGVTTWVRR